MVNRLPANRVRSKSLPRGQSVPVVNSSPINSILPRGQYVPPSANVTTSAFDSPPLSPANPTAVAGPVAINGSAITYMQSDAAPAVQIATSIQKGLVQPDNTTITIAAGIISAIEPIGANPTAVAGPIAINGTATTFMRSDAAPSVQKGSSSQFGIVEVDNTSIKATAGVISAIRNLEINFSCMDISTKPVSTVLGGKGTTLGYTLPSVANGLVISGQVAIGPSAQTDFSILKNGVSFLIIRFAASATTPTAIAASNTSFSPTTDQLSFKTPANLNSMSGVFWVTILGTVP